MTPRHSIVCASYLILRRDDEVLLSLRQGTGWMDGYYSFLSGHLEAHESPKQALIREAEEEIGITLDMADLRLVHLLSKPLRQPDRIAFFFEASRWTGEIENREPHKCGGLGWFKGDALPTNTVPSVAETFACVLRNETYSESDERN